MSRAIKRSIFSDENIQSMFGHEAAENECPERLRQYYFKSQTFDRVTADLPLKILVVKRGLANQRFLRLRRLKTPISVQSLCRFVQTTYRA